MPGGCLPRERKRPVRRRPSNGKKDRPLTPVLGLSKQKAAPSSWHQGVDGILRRWLPARWFKSRPHEAPRVVTIAASTTTRHQSPPPEAAPASTATAAAPPAQRVDREAAAARLSVDLPTYNLIMDLQHRDITPDDYDTLRSLDSSVKPRTIDKARIDEIAPRWKVPKVAASPKGKRTAASPNSPSGGRRVLAMPAAFSKATRPLTSQTCVICLEKFAVGDAVRKLPCSHVFHAACVDEWLTSSSDHCAECGQAVDVKKE